MPDPKEAWAFLESSDPISSAEEVQAAIARIASEIEARLAKTYPLDLDYGHLSRYGAATRGTAVQWRVKPDESVRGRTVLVVDDILDHGETLRAIRDGLLEMGAQAFYSAVLVEKDLGRRKPLAADFVGLRISDRFVFGCGMDAKGFWRNLPEIRAMRES